MGARHHRLRNRRVFRCREVLAGQVGADPTLGIGWVGRDAQVAPALVLTVGGTLLERLTLTVTDTHLDNPRQRKRDEKQLTDALKDVAAVRRCWAFLTHAVANRLAEHESIAVLDARFPLSEDDRSSIDIAPDAYDLGYWSPEWVCTSHAFGTLIGEDEANNLEFFENLVPYSDLPALASSWAEADHTYNELWSVPPMSSDT